MRGSSLSIASRFFFTNSPAILYSLKKTAIAKNTKTSEIIGNMNSDGIIGSNANADFTAALF